MWLVQSLTWFGLSFPYNSPWPDTFLEMILYFSREQIEKKYKDLWWQNKDWLSYVVCRRIHIPSINKSCKQTRRPPRLHERPCDRFPKFSTRAPKMFTPLLPRGKIRSKVSVLFIQNKSKARAGCVGQCRMGVVWWGRGERTGEKIRARSRVQCRHLNR